ncbi:hypothetical protein CVIRNUC_009639 [Coccomyxa viridis]|uniref:tRNA/rRNA methyltransferase SpoU type domain-containing protein n=1 Tax=Coccomyxa viridis TaxID=1274662 RepID=A0AAV1IIF5_9CHLO|nr:hypothetical protein CVIRNUC_009639 [Coccomyxa viridis]
MLADLSNELQTQGPVLPVRGSLFSGSWGLASKSAQDVAQTPSRFPYLDRFDVQGQAATSQEVVQALSGQVFDGRLRKIEEVARSRCYTLLPVVEAMGFGSIHCIDTSTGRVKSSRANRTSKGAEKWLDVQEHRHGTAACIAHLQACGFRVLVTQLTQDSVPIHDVDLTQPTAFILGNEVDGASEEAVRLADQAVTVPMSPSFVESFNVSVAAALIMSEARRQRAAAPAPPSGLAPAEAQILTATMLLKHRGPRAVQWHPHWKGLQQVSRPGSPAADSTEQHTSAPLCSTL